MSDLTKPPFVPSGTSTGEGVQVSDATVTPRTDAALIDELVCADGQTAFIKGKTVPADFARTLERELAAAKAEIAALRAMLAKCTPLDVGERAELGNLCDRETAYQATIEHLRAEVEAFKANNRYMRGHTAGYEEARSEFEPRLRTEEVLHKSARAERDQLRARVAELETVVAKAGSIAFGAPELNMCNYDHEQVRQLNDAMCEVFAILDAARDGNGAT